MRYVSLDALRDKEHDLLDYEHDDTAGLGVGTTTDRFMELNYGRMGEDSEEAAMREKRADRLLYQGRSFPNYIPQ